MKPNFYSDPQAYGTEQYYKHFESLLYTDGIKNMCDKLGCYWLIDIIFSYHHRLKQLVQHQKFYFIIELIRREDDEKYPASADFYITVRGEEKESFNTIHQFIEFTDIEYDVQIPMSWDGNYFITSLWSED